MRNPLLLILVISITSALAQETINNAGTIHVHGTGTIAVFGDIENSGTWNSNTGKLFLVGNAAQRISGTSLGTSDLVLDNSNGVDLATILEAYGQVDFVSGVIRTDRTNGNTEHLHFMPGSSSLNASDASHVDGYVKKTGNTAFTFPVGDDGQIQQLRSSAPALPSSALLVAYVEGDPVAISNTASHDPSLVHVSDCEYWMVIPSAGAVSTQLTIDYDANSCGTALPADLRVGYYDGTTWKDQGNTALTGNAASGTVRSNAFQANGPVSFATVSFSNVLPVELLYFVAHAVNDEVRLKWLTVSESENSHFEVERSLDVENWEFVGWVNGAGNSNSSVSYSLKDEEPYIGMSFYRLKQIDFNGNFAYSDIETVFFDPELESAVYPNPAIDQINVKLNAQSGVPHIELFDASGRQVPVSSSSTSGANYALNIGHVAPGTYFLKVRIADYQKVHEVLIR